jgi:recombination protein RecA
MSSAVVSTSAALGRPFVFDDEAEAAACSLSSARRASLDRAAPSTALRAGLGGCPYMSFPAFEDGGAPDSPIARVFQSAIKNQPSKILPASVTPASQLTIRPAPEMVSSGIPALDALTGGLPRGCLTEICGPASSGCTTVLLAALAAATRRGEFCAVVDASDALDPHSAAAAGVELDRLLWVRCGEDPPQKSSSPKSSVKKTGCPISRASFAREVGAREECKDSQAAFEFDRTSSRRSERRLEQVLRATDLLLESGGFGLIVLDLADLPPQAARYIPLTTWFRFRRAIEHTPTMLLAIEQQAIAGSCSSLLLKLGAAVSNSAVPAGLVSVFPRYPNECRRSAANVASAHDAPASSQSPYPTHAQLLTGLDITAELIRSRQDRKPARSVAFASKTAWAG